MALREKIITYSKGDNLSHYWKLFRQRKYTKNRFLSDVFTYRLNRIAHKHGGYIGNGAVIDGIPSLPHGMHGIYISRYAVIGKNCRIYQNVTIGEVANTGPQIGENCLIGAGAIIIGRISIGSNVKIGAGTVVTTDIPDNCTVVSLPPRVIGKEVAADVSYESTATAQ